jgi:hypothetical protein
VRLAFRAAAALHLLVVGALAAHLVAILVTGGYRAQVLGIELSGSRIAPPLIALLALLVAGLPLHGRSGIRGTYSAHVPLVLFAGLLVAYLANDATLDNGDSLPARYLPFSILRRGDFFLDGIPALAVSPRPHFVQRVRGQLVSDYPVGAALLALPLYVPSVLGGVPPDSALAEQLEKLSAATIVAASAVLLYLTLGRLTSTPIALVLAAVYGLGTSNLDVSSQAQWQHGAGQLALAAALLCLVYGRRDPTWLARAGLPLAFAVLCRPPNAILIAPLVAYAVLRRPCPWRFFVWALSPIAFQLWYSATYFGDPFRSQFPLLGSGLWSMQLSDGLAGLLLSPGRGLLAYSPVFIFSAAGMVLAWRRGGDALMRALSVGVVASVLLYARWIAWWGGLAYHPPRILVDLTPALVVLLVPVMPAVRRSLSARALFAALVLWSVLAHALTLLAPRRVEAFSSDRFFERVWAWSEHPVMGRLPGVASRHPESHGRAIAIEAPGPARADLRPFFAALFPGATFGPDLSRERPAALDKVELAVNGDTFRPGSVLRLRLQVSSSPGSPVRDLYAGLVFPDGKAAAFFAGPGVTTTPVPLGRPGWFVRLRSVPGGTEIRDEQLFDLDVHSHIAFGTFQAFAALVDRRVPADGVPAGWTVVAGDVKPLHLARD